jgi:tungstate transport system substrate-binding protein
VKPNNYAGQRLLREELNMTRKALPLVALVLLLLLISACGNNKISTDDHSSEQSTNSNKEMILATTTSTQDSGLLDTLIPVFEESTGIKVKVIAVGTGQAIKLGEDGNADVILVHARKAEDKFVADGYGVNAYDVMYNQFYIVGPESDPAQIQGMTSVTEAFQKIAEAEAKFISRGDDSGTHKKELSIWEKSKISPEGDWYISVGQGMGVTLQMANEMNAYTLVDEATYLTTKPDLKTLVQGDPILFNPYGIIQVKETRNPDLVNEFISFITGEKGQKLIGEFGKGKYGKALFVPSVKKRE